MSGNGRIHYLPPRYKSFLIGANDFIKKGFNVVDHDFSKDFVDGIAEANWSELLHSSRVTNF